MNNPLFALKNKQKMLFILLCIALIGAVFFVWEKEKGSLYQSVWKSSLGFSDDEMDHAVGHTVTIQDESGKTISMAARGVVVNDEIITAQGNHYKIVKVKGNEAQAKLLGVDKQFIAYHDYFKTAEIPASVLAQTPKQCIGIYHTHSDESYVPTDGTESIPFNGGIYKVGQQLVGKLKDEHVRVDYDTTPHDPHDNNAYYRSRRTATNIMKNNPVALIDVHRDGIPDPNYYKAEIADMDVAQLRLVIGRQNPNMNANLDFAKRMMAYANETHPGIVKEIFMAKGNYNQDLMPTALLIEAGTHTNTRQEAANGVALFADAIPVVLGLTNEIPNGGGNSGTANNLTPNQTQSSAQSSGAWKSLGWILGIAILGSVAFLIISSGGVKEAKNKLLSLVNKEFTGFLGPRRNKRKSLEEQQSKEPKKNP